MCRAPCPIAHPSGFTKVQRCGEAAGERRSSLAWGSSPSQQCPLPGISTRFPSQAPAERESISAILFRSRLQEHAREYNPQGKTMSNGGFARARVAGEFAGKCPILHRRCLYQAKR